MWPDVAEELALLRKQIAEVAQIQIDHAAATATILAELGARVKQLERKKARPAPQRGRKR